MQQEDDLRGLTKVMEFMRAISTLLVIVNIYWYCYQSLKDSNSFKSSNKWFEFCTSWVTHSKHKAL